jgi:hypothetical protein
MWDFIQRSRHNLKEAFVTEQNPPVSAAKKHEAWNEVRGRMTYTQVLIEDRGPKLTMLTGGDPSQGIFDFGDDIRAKVVKAVDSFGDGPIDL